MGEASREMTLDEYVAVLGPHHAAAKELAALRARVAELELSDELRTMERCAVECERPLREAPNLRCRNVVEPGCQASADAIRALAAARKDASAEPCDHRFEADPGMYDTSHRYCAKCGRAE